MRVYHYSYWGITTLSALDNMALEEYFLRHAAEHKSAHIRFYDFSKDSVVIGYNQALDAVKRWDTSFHVARRGTGGSHVHVAGNILAYSFIIPRDGSFSNHPDFRAYYADRVARALEKIGIPNITTDHKASTIMQDGKVIASHAVRWGVKSALLHGLLTITPYNVNLLLQRIHLGTRVIGSKEYAEADALRVIPTVTQALPQLKPHATPEQKAQYCKELIAAAILQEVAGTDYTRAELNETIMAQARIIQEQRYATETWLRQRDPTFTPEEIEELPGERLDGPLKEKWGYCLYIQVPDKDFKKMALPREEP
jgi:lipoate-protein ligase A